MVHYYTIAYKLKTHDLAGVKSDFEKTTSSYVAHEIAESEHEALDKLKSKFSMLDIEIISVSGMKTMTEEEFASNATAK